MSTVAASTLGEQVGMWKVQRAQREALGDDLGRVRPVDHFAFFGLGGGAGRAAAGLRAAGFDVAVARKGLRKALQATRDESLGEDAVESFLTEVITLVEREGGSYDGWGAPVVE